jgi:fructose/tagatose bisphosphate aldolase
MLVPLAPLLADARSGGYAVATFTVFNFETARGVLEALEIEGVPAGVAVTRRMTSAMDFEGLAAHLVAWAQAADTDIALHLDHATDLDLVRRALDAGFTSIQYDGVRMELAEKISSTRVAVELAARYGASVEAELDHIGRTGVEAGGGLTDPDEAASFVAETGIDIVAVSVGTTHGLGEEGGGERRSRRGHPRRHAGAPALHGGTACHRRSRCRDRRRITKVSYFHGMAHDASMRCASRSRQRHGMLACALDESLRPAFRDRCRQMIRLYGGSGRAPGA